MSCLAGTLQTANTPRQLWGIRAPTCPGHEQMSLTHSRRIVRCQAYCQFVAQALRLGSFLNWFLPPGVFAGRMATQQFAVTGCYWYESKILLAAAAISVEHELAILAAFHVDAQTCSFNLLEFFILLSYRNDCGIYVLN
jgi:hypothetical protein